jgi:hypothetical protein
MPYRQNAALFLSHSFALQAFGKLGILGGAMEDLRGTSCGLPPARQEDRLMENVQDPRQHINEEPRNDFNDVAVGFAGMFAFMVVVFAAAVIIKFLIS